MTGYTKFLPTRNAIADEIRALGVHFVELLLDVAQVVFGVLVFRQEMRHSDDILAGVWAVEDLR